MPVSQEEQVTHVNFTAAAKVFHFLKNDLSALERALGLYWQHTLRFNGAFLPLFYNGDTAARPGSDRYCHEAAQNLDLSQLIQMHDLIRDEGNNLKLISGLEQNNARMHTAMSLLDSCLQSLPPRTGLRM